MHRIETLSLPAAGFAKFTYPRFRPRLDGEDPKASIEAIGAYVDDLPVGLALLRHQWTMPDEPPGTRLCSIVVARMFRRMGIATALMKAVIDAARRAGSQSLIAYHSDQTKDRNGFERFLAATGWAAPELAEFRLAGEAGWTERACSAWAPTLRRLADMGYTAEPWEGITAEDRARAGGLVPAGSRFDYRIYEPHCDPRISIVLRKHGALVGWVFGENQAENGYHHYTNGYAIPELQSLGWLAAGVYDVCRLQSVAYGPKSVAVYETFGANTRMIAFMRRRLQPFTLWMDERYQTRRAVSAI